MAESEYCVAFTTTANTQEATRIAEELVLQRLAACVNIVPSIRSIYRWKGGVQQDTESLLIIKTERARIAELEKAIRKLHSYEVPELIVLDIESGLTDYLQWIADSVKEPS
ncbi:MAG TPA: divalent-cation tolerance protein CutA [Acidobacteriota bacterium]|nr:divalent-cation tolerance protein CutA [Acidobacteriota bacterium]